MWLTFEINFKVGKRQISGTRYFDIEYEILKKDLEDYISSENYSCFQNYFKDYLKEQEELDLMLDGVMQEWFGNFECLMPKSEIECFEKFLIQKYQEPMEEWLLEHLIGDKAMETLFKQDSDFKKQLDELITHDFKD